MSKGRAELVVAALLALAALCAVGFAVVFIVSADTQVLGLTAGAAFGALAAAAIIAGGSLVSQAKRTEERPRYSYEVETPAETEGLRQDLLEGGEGISRRKLLAGTAGAAGVALGAAAAVPIASLGPNTTKALTTNPWREGLKLVDENDVPVESRILELGSFLTAFPEGAEKNTFGAPIVVVRVEPDSLDLPPERAEWAPEGLLAFSKICTHAGCAVNLYRSPLYEPVSPSPALVCPCHYSTFEVRSGAKVIFGPAGRPLPQLPLRIEDGVLVAAGPLSGRVGPAWRGVRKS